jgi:adenylate kinase
VRLIIFGPPGSGKGTHSERISSLYGITHVSTGDILRSNVARNTELGKMASSFLVKGQYLPNSIVNRIVSEWLRKNDCQKGFILDGYPRTIDQEEALEGIMKELNIQIDLVINLEVPDEEIINRLSTRRVCSKCKAIFNLLSNPPRVEDICDTCGGNLYIREDDKPEVIMNRLAIYKRDTKPILDQYAKQKKLINVIGKGSIDVVSDRIRKVLDRLHK